MALSANHVSAVIVTRGNVPLEPIVESLPYSECIVWNDLERGSKGCYGRYLAMQEAKHDVIFFVDDDVIFTAHDELLAAYEPGRIVANMPSPWYELARYDQLGCCLVGAGSLVPRNLPWRAFKRYLAVWPEDKLFLTYCDQISGIINPSKRCDFGYEVMPYASGPDRIYTQPGADMRKAIVQRRALDLR